MPAGKEWTKRAATDALKNRPKCTAKRNWQRTKLGSDWDDEIGLATVWLGRWVFL
jgi:hypothetical protein